MHGNVTSMWYSHYIGFCITKNSPPHIAALLPHTSMSTPIDSELPRLPEIAIPIRDVYGKAVEKKPRAPRKKSRYSQEEKLVLEKYKHAYRKTTNADERYDLLRNRLLVDIFNYWFEKGEVTPAIGEKALSEKIRVRCVNIYITVKLRLFFNDRNLVFGSETIGALIIKAKAYFRMNERNHEWI
jgi:hypothetical protein